MRNSDRKHTVTAELTKSAKRNATFLELDSHARLPRGLHASRTNCKVFRSPKVHINSIENGQKRKTPGYPIDNDLFSFRGKLVEDCAQ